MNTPLKPIRIVPDSGKPEESGMEATPKLRLRADSGNTSAPSMAESSDEMPNATAMASAAMPVGTRYQCPHCGAMLETDEAVEGNRVPCPECGQEFVATPMPKPTLQPIQPSLSSAGKTFRRKKGKAHIALWIFVALVLLAGGFAGAWCTGIVQHIQSPEQNGQSYWTARTGGVEWKFRVQDDNSVEIIGANVEKSVTDVKIPSFFGWRRTRGLWQAFAGCDQLLSVQIPAGVTHIGMDTFNGCTSLKSIEFPESVEKISLRAFSGCSELKTVKIPSRVKGLYLETFKDCKNLETVILPAGLKEITLDVFRGCEMLKNINLPDGLSKIGIFAFCGCKNLERLDIPESVTEIGAAAFLECSSLKSVVIPPGVKSIDEATFGECTSLTSVSIPNTVTNIGLTAFMKCTSLASVTIPPNVKSIESKTFCGCQNLSGIKIPNGVTNIGDYAFFKCEGLKEVHVPDSVQMIGPVAFGSCSEMVRAKIGAGVTNMGEGAFVDCSKLTDLVMGTGVIDIESNAFMGCESLLSVQIPDSTKHIGERSFESCSGLTNLILGSNVVSIGNQAFVGCSSLTALDIPNSVREIGVGAFGNCRALSRVRIGNGVRKLDRTFVKCEKLSELEMGAHEIENFSFYGCINLKSISMSDSVQRIAVGAFAGAWAIQTIHVPTSWRGRNMFSEVGLPEGCRLVYGDGFEEDVGNYAVPQRNSVEQNRQDLPNVSQKAVVGRPVLPEYAELAGAVEAAKVAGTAEHFKKMMEVWTGLGAKEKAATQKNVLWAYCAMLWSKGNTAAAAKRQGAINYSAFLNAVTDPCRSCGGRGSKRETCRYCGGTGMVKSGGSGSGSCSFCHGSGQVGGRLGGHPSTCPKCGGSGKSASVSGGKKACPNCTGGTISESCRTCGGTGRIYSESKCKRVVEENLEEALRICHGESGAGRRAGGAAADDEFGTFW